MRPCVISTCLLLVTISVVAASPQGKLRGTIRDSEGAVIAKAFILIHSDQTSDSKSDILLRTNSLGEYSTALPPGFYDVFVSSGGFSPMCRKVWIREGKTAVYDTALIVDPVEEREHGFFIPTQ